MKIRYTVFLSIFLAGCASVKYADQHDDPGTSRAHPYGSRERALSFEEAKSKWTQEIEDYVLAFKLSPEINRDRHHFFEKKWCLSLFIQCAYVGNRYPAGENADK